MPLAHYVSEEAFDPEATVAAGSVPSEKYLNASQGRIIWWRFLRHRIAVISLVILGVSYASILISEFLAPYDLHERHSGFIYAPPQPVHFFHEGRFVGPFVYPLDFELNMETLKREYVTDTSEPQSIRFFCSGGSYSFWGIFESDNHLICPPEGGEMFLLGTDRLGRDMLSRLIYGARISLTIGLVGVTLSYLVGIIVGGMAGYWGGLFDAVVQRITEVLRSIPELPLWLALSAALPVTWDPRIIYFGITLILAALDWPSIARAVRSKLFALREEDYVAAAEMMGAFLPRPGIAAADHELGRAPVRGAEHRGGSALSVVAFADGAGDDRGSRLLVPRRRPPRRHRPARIAARSPDGAERNPELLHLAARIALRSMRAPHVRHFGGSCLHQPYAGFDRAVLELQRAGDAFRNRGRHTRCRIMA
jgi:peptide/nickel transport system permease protein